MPADLWVSPSDSGTEVSTGSVAESLAIARWCASHGWPVHPLAPGRKTPAGNCETCRDPAHDRKTCICRTAGRWCHGFHAATLDMTRINEWWATRPQMGVGVACGPANLIVIDVDAHAAVQPARNKLLPGIAIADDIDVSQMTTGFHTLAVLAALRAQPNPADDTSTLRVRTPSGGLHIWYRATDGRRWQCSTGTGSGRALAWQVDIRAHGGYIIAPGTATSVGTYTPVGTARMPAPLPTWLAHELERTHHLPPLHIPAPRPVPARARQAVIAAGGGRGPATKALATVLAEVAACAAAPEGTGFSEKLNRAAFTAGGLAAAGHLTEEDAERILLETAELARPGQERHSAQIIRSGMTAGARRPLRSGSRP
ncbi:bifunctional DNA primase/polymerase [Streptomyces sp. HNM0663]|uniref:Bifunctional DNA primase/polymerase n=1 Tax=Streptomyces chengmaiensis TaxID=3040919 RepID=A0ABT6HV01_9ACTN|nr:bifunctional DNA primase/polymerase [Streptomyces chengmaiensis]MDH2392200.1 bifunctional DNA primase/polymerase [Streptomyces chengmaiensis]